MDKSEPALVPQWLKVASGCGSGSTSHHSTTSIHSDDIGVPFSAARHRSLFQSHSFAGTVQNDYDSPRNSTLIDKAHSSSSRRVNGISDRDRAYASFNRNSSFRGDRDRDSHRFDKDREWVRDLDFRDRDKTIGGGDYRDKDLDRCFDYRDRDEDRYVDYRDKDQDRYDSHLWANLSFAGKSETDAALKCSQSTHLSRRTENGSRRSGNELGSLSAPLVVGNLVSNINKAAFERNFPSLGSEDKQAGNHLSLTSSTGSNSIRHGQGSVGVSEIGRASSPGLSSQGPPLSGSVFVADGWSSALADAPVPNGVNNVPLTSSQQTTATSVSSVTPGIVSSGGLNMAEALVQNPPRVRTPPQLSNETQRLEELALKQSRQLIPMTPSMPKTMGFGPSEKLKPKSLRVMDSPAASGKVGQQISSPHRSVARPETSKVPQSGKLLVLRPAREKNGVLKSVKSDSLSPTKGGNISNIAVCAQTAGSGAVGSSSLTGTRKSIMLERKAISISSLPVSTAVDCGALQRSKDNVLVNEDKKPLSQGQNRNDFFNALRKKASRNFSVPGIEEKSRISTEHKTIEPKPNDFLDSESKVNVKENGLLENVGRNSDNEMSTIELECKLDSNINAASGVVQGADIAAEFTETGSPESSNVYCVMGGTEEEEAAFLRSLGWEENAAGEEALTEEEINAFYQQMKSRAVSTTLRRSKFPNVVDEMRASSLGSISSEQSSSDSETDDS